MSSCVRLCLPLLMFCSLQIAIVEGCLTLNGQTPVFQDNGNRVRNGFSDQTQAISRDLQFSCYGNVTGWAAYSERAGTFNSIKFQVWRLVQDTGCRTYQLVGSHNFSAIPTDTNTRLLNISSVMDFGQIPIPVQPGDVIGFYGDFSIGSRINIQSNPSNDFLSYFASPVTSTNVDALTEASTCSDLTGTEGGAPVITAYVITQGVVTTITSETTSQPPTTTFEPTTQLSTTTEPVTTSTTEATQPIQTIATSMATTIAKLPQTTAEPTRTTTVEIQKTTSGLTAGTTDLTQPEATSEMPTTGYVESSLGFTFNESVTTINNEFATTTNTGEDMDNNSTQQQSNDDVEQREEEPISRIVILSVIIALVSGIVVVVLCLIVGTCVCRRLHRKQRRRDLTSLSFNAPDGNRNRTDSHIYCEMSEVFEKKKDRTESFSDLDHVSAFKELDCSCKIPHRYPTSDYEVPIKSVNLNQGGREDFENTYETPLDAKMRMQQGEAQIKDSEERKRLESIYDVPKPVEEEEYTFMGSVPMESRLSETADNIYENVVNQ